MVHLLDLVGEVESKRGGVMLQMMVVMEAA
jgi:hypothetical protein